MSLRDRLDRKSIIRRVESRIDKRAHRVRNAPGRRAVKKLPKMENRNVGGGTLIGAVEAGIALLLKETIGVPLGSDTEVVDSQITSDGVIYTVNVDAPMENMAEARAFLESGTGFTSYLTDLIEVDDAEVLKHRVLRDTYQVEVLVRD